MRRFESNVVGVDQGSLVMFSDFQHDGIMWTGSGQREHSEYVSFNGSYKEAPVVQVSISMWDFDSATNQRGHIVAENVTTDGFKAVFKTWGDTRIARLRVDWTAIGPVNHEDNWELY